MGLFALTGVRCLIVPSKIEDVYRVADHLRAEDAAEIAAFGLNPREALRNSYRHAILRRTAFVDGEIAAMWGLGGAMLSDCGNPWLMTTPAVERVPVTFLKVGRAQLDEMLAQRAFLFNFVQASYWRACRFLEVLGFVLDPATPMGPNNVPFRRFWMER
jgi:hypothetical protein